MAIKKSKPKLLIVFDTSVLYTHAASNLVRDEIGKLIKENSNHSDVIIEWNFPNLVIDERKFQMRNKAFELLPSIEKLEKLLGHNLNITKDILITRVDEAINRQLDELGISTLNFEKSEVDLNDLVNRSVFRRPPFEAGNTEKGFRDSIIAETFLQLFRKSPKTPSVCLLVFVTGDILLQQYILESTKDAKNVRVILKINELEGLINTLVSKVTEEFVEALKEKAKKYFFEEENKGCLFYKEKIRSKISNIHEKELKISPWKHLERENGTWLIDSPIFEKKERQRLFYMSPIIVNAKLFKYESSKSNISDFIFHDTKAHPDLSHNFELYPMQGLSIVPGSAKELLEMDTIKNYNPFLVSNYNNNLTPSFDIWGKNQNNNLSGIIQSAPEKIMVAQGQSRFEIRWSVNINPSKKFTTPHIENIQFISTKWNEQ